MTGVFTGCGKPDEPTEERGSSDIEMVYVQGGEFEMGATAEQGGDAYADESPVRTVRLDSYHIGKYEVTQAQWKDVMGTDPSYFKGDNLPVENVSWEEAQEFCRILSERTGRKYTLPTEAQWEYAARGGNRSRHHKYAGSDNPDEVAWYADNSGNGTHPVGRKKANELGIHDMSGNVWEWCLDRYTEDSFRVNRGGGWSGDAVSCRVSDRHYSGPGLHNNFLGFRVVCVSE